jgi:hypothetical protein
MGEWIDWLAYREEDRVMKNCLQERASVAALARPPAIYGEIRDTTLWSFVKFMAQRYRAAPVKTEFRQSRYLKLRNVETVGINDERAARSECQGCSYKGSVEVFRMSPAGLEGVYAKVLGGMERLDDQFRRQERIECNKAIRLT